AHHGHESHGGHGGHGSPALAGAGGPTVTVHREVHDGDRFVPLLLTLFFFVLGCNLLGMVPWAGSPTASFSVTLALAGVTMLTVIVAGMLKFGFLGFFANQVPTMDLPLPLAILLKPMIFAIEMLGLCIKHLILAVRLLANMVAGHLVLLGIMGLISAAATYSMGLWATVTGISVVSCTLFSLLELFVAFLQAYIFTFLSALFIGASVHQH
ncbi:MAG: F0F1 ATP synthase subunit A, partial [Planctomycetota bacterium]